MSQGTNRVIVVRVRGLPQDYSAATTLIKAAINDPTENYKATIVPSCDRSNESVALIDFKQKLPANLAPLESDRLTPWQISVDDEDLSFDQNFLGFTQLYPTKETIQADIVAVCGIDGHAYGSWQGRGPLRRMWLRHFLCKDLPSCRTMVYGYKAKLSSKDSATTEDYAKDFLEALCRIRQKVPANRPIIFVAHSFGGLVIARAMVKLKQALLHNEAALASIYKSICGLLFFAVPFRGIDIEDMGRIMDAQNHPRATLLKHFAIGSGDLKKHLEDFIDVLYGLKVVSFFETEQSRRLIRNDSGEWERSGEFFTTLEADNAVLNLPREIETRIALHSDHSGIVKFDDRYDAGYEYAIKFLRTFLENINQGRLQRQKFDNELSTSQQAYRSQGSFVDDVVLQQTLNSGLNVEGTAQTWQFTAVNKALDDATHSKNNHSPRVRPLRTKSRSKEDNDCLAKLVATDPRLDKKRIQATKGGLLKDSYYWVLGNEQYKKWHGSSSDNLLWIRGDPGKGKTMLLCGIIDEFDETQSLAYFFCQATDSRLNTATAVLRGLIYMLADQSPSVISHIRRRFERGSIPEGANAWWALCDMLEEIFRELESTYLLVDALDECGSGREELIQFVRQTSSSTEYQAKWITSSRNWPDIKSSLYSVSSLSLELNAKSVSSAVVYYIHYKVSSLAVKKSYDYNTRDHILDYLLAHAKGTFLWVALVCTNLEKTKSWNARQTIAMFPPDLERVYERMMQFICQSGDSEYHQRVLVTVANLYRPVSSAELQTLVDLPKEITETVTSLVDFIDDCGSFLTIQNNRIEFVHQSAKDYIDRYLEKQGISGSRTLHLSILDRSIREMSRALKKDNYGLKDPSLDISCVELPDVDHLRGIYYACLYWFQHLKAFKLERTEGHLIDLLYNFIKDKFLYWLEAVSLFHSVQYVISLLHEFQLSLELYPEFDALRDLVHDSCRFAQFFREGIVHNPLQIYVSGMLFCPKQSAYKEQLMRQKPSWLELQLQEDSFWSSIITRIDKIVSKAIVYSHDGKRIATRDDYSGTLHVWDAVSGVEIRELVNQSSDDPDALSNNSTSSTSSMEDGPDEMTGRYSPSAEHDQTIGSPRNVYKGGYGTTSHNSSVSSARLAEDDSDDAIRQRGLLAEYDETNKSPRSESEETHGSISHFNINLTFAPSDDKVYYISNQGCLMSWDLQTGDVLQLADIDFSMYFHVLSSDGIHVAYITDGHIVLYRIDVQTKLSLSKDQPGLFEVLAFSSNGTGLCASSPEGHVVVWDILTEKVVGSVDIASSSISSLALTNNLKTLLAASRAKDLLTVTAVESGSTLWSSSWASYVAFSYDSQKLVCGIDWILDMLNVSDGSLFRQMYGCSVPAAFSPDCRQLVCGTYAGFWLIDLTKVDEVWSRAQNAVMETVRFSHKPSRFSVQRGKHYELWDLENGSLVWKQIGRVASGGSGNCLVSVTPDTSTPMVWRLGEDSVEMVNTVPDFGNLIESIFLAPDDTRALVSTLEPQLFIWDLETNAIRPLSAANSIDYDPGYRSISWDINTRRIAFPTPHDTASVIDLCSGDVLLRVHSFVFTYPYKHSEISLSSSGKIFACVDTSSSIAVWDVDLHRLVSRIEISFGHFERLNIYVSKDDQRLVVRQKSSIEIFDIATNSLLQRFRFDSPSLLKSISQNGAEMSVHTDRGVIVIKNDEMVVGTDDGLFSTIGWLYRNSKKLIWIPPQFFIRFAYDGKGSYVMDKENGGLLAFRTRFDSTGLNEI